MKHVKSITIPFREQYKLNPLCKPVQFLRPPQKKTPTKQQHTHKKTKKTNKQHFALNKSIIASYTLIVLLSATVDSTRVDIL